MWEVLPVAVVTTGQAAVAGIVVAVPVASEAVAYVVAVEGEVGMEGR